MSAEYFLGASEWAGARLRLQHELTKTNLDGHVLDPSIPPLKPGMRIADVACGTGIWLLDALDTAPSGIAADGLDINLEIAPPKAWLPAQVSFRQVDILKVLPDELVAQYDVVNIQFSSSFVRDPHSKQFVANLMRMLKPGGYLQMTESDVSRWSFLTATNSTQPPEMLKLYDLIGDIFGGFKQWTWLEDVEHTFADAGMRDIVVRKPKAKTSTLQPNLMNILLAQLEAGEMLARHPVLETRVPEQKAQRDRAAREARELGTGMDLAIVRCVGRKPL